MAIEYQWSEGGRYQGDAQAIGEWLDGFGEAVTPAQIVNDARKKSSPGHFYFEWDDTAAAEAYRLEQARCLIRHIDIVIEGTGTRAFHQVTVSIDDEDQRVYMTSLKISQHGTLGDQVIERALRELKGWKKRYGQYRDLFGGVFAAIAATEKSNGKRRRKAAVA